MRPERLPFYLSVCNFAQFCFGGLVRLSARKPEDLFAHLPVVGGRRRRNQMAHAGPKGGVPHRSRRGFTGKGNP